MKIKDILVKVWVSFLLYMFTYGSLLLFNYYPNITPREVLLRPIIDLFHLELVASVMFLVMIITFFTILKIVDKKTKIDKLKSELKSIQKKRDEGDEFINAINILRHTRFSYFLGQNSSMIEIRRLEYLCEELKLLKIAVEFIALKHPF